MSKKNVYKLNYSFEAPDILKSDFINKPVTKYFEEGELYKIEYTNHRITFIRNMIYYIISQAYKLTAEDTLSVNSYNTVNIPDEMIHLCYLLFLYSFKDTNASNTTSPFVGIMYDMPLYLVLMREMMVDKNIDIRRIDAEICILKGRYNIIAEDDKNAKTQFYKYKTVIQKIPRVYNCIKNVFGYDANN
jgi:hypothetical protein